MDGSGIEPLLPINSDILGATATPTSIGDSNDNGVMLLFIFVMIAIVLAFLIAIACIILFCICFCNRKANKIIVKDAKSSISLKCLPTKDESHFDVVRPITPSHTSLGSKAEFEPRELLAYPLPETFRPLPLPATMTPRNSVQESIFHTMNEGVYEEPRQTLELQKDTNYVEPIDNLDPRSFHSNRVLDPNFNPYGDDLEVDQNFMAPPPPPPLPPPPPPRRYPSLPKTELSVTSNSNIYDHIKSLESSMLKEKQPNCNVEALPYAPIYDINQNNRLTHLLFQISPQCVRIIKELGIGHFGKVFLAATINVSLKDLQLSDDTNRHQSILVAVKQLSPSANYDLKEAFHSEIKFMSHLQHANVIRLLAVCMTGTPFIMMEYMENGDLNEFLRKQNIQPDTVSSLDENQISPVVLLYITVQIASGMRYLANKKFIHRDLATRNCLVGRNFVTKIAGFGMSHNFYESSYCHVAGQLILPIRWMATETYYGKFSVKSDAWSFGVTVWEIFTLCQSLPYSEMSDDHVIADAISGENRKILAKPEHCPDEVYDVLGRCFVHDPSVRADFEEIYSRLFVIYTTHSEKLN